MGVFVVLGNDTEQGVWHNMYVAELRQVAEQWTSQ
jgi:hypothetical protein